MANGHLAAASAAVRPPCILPLQISALGFTAADRPLLYHISLSLQAGALMVILGPNGAGKSLLLRLCHGLLQPTAGLIDWAGLPPAAARQQMAMVFQRPVLLRRSVAANVAYALSLRGVSRRQQRQRVAEALACTDLTHLADRPARVLSGGEQQRLALARAWALRPQALLLDEPTANLDPAATQAIEVLIRTLHQAGTTIMMTTHNLGQARRLASEIVFLHRGLLLEHTPAGEFFDRPRTAEAMAFLRGELLC